MGLRLENHSYTYWGRRENVPAAGTAHRFQRAEGGEAAHSRRTRPDSADEPKRGSPAHLILLAKPVGC